MNSSTVVVCDTAKVRFFKQITTYWDGKYQCIELFAILQKYDFSSKSQLSFRSFICNMGCLRYCKSTIFQANHNYGRVRAADILLFAILQKYDFSSKSQRADEIECRVGSCLRYCKSTIFQANHNTSLAAMACSRVVCDTAKVRFFKQITTL